MIEIELVTELYSEAVQDRACKGQAGDDHRAAHVPGTCNPE